MQLKKAIKIAEDYQLWRLGVKDELNYKSNEITKALDTIIAYAKIPLTA